ncbi:UBA domain-containing protein [Acrasis kona]|uniref:UBA domain-containing protein n=1 Tax=Acrasis kona TaxID=1008807 RepID=A0AAW2YY93_9EUKA
MFSTYSSQPKVKLPPPHQQGVIYNNNVQGPHQIQQIAQQQQQQQIAQQQQQQTKVVHPVKIHLSEDEIRRLDVVPQEYSFSQLQDQILKYLPTLNKEGLEDVKKRHLMIYYRDDESHQIRMDSQTEWLQSINIAKGFKESKILHLLVKINNALLEKEKQFPETIPKEEEHITSHIRTHSLPEPAFQQVNLQSTPSYGGFQFSNNITRTTPVPMFAQQPIQLHPQQLQQPQQPHQVIVQHQPQQPQQQVHIDYNSVLSKLHDMGFKDDQKSVELLRQFNGNTESVINHYLVNEGHK